jgi:hypothetical protein
MLCPVCCPVCAGTSYPFNEIWCYNRAMPRRDFLHDSVKNALIKAAWTITDDPFRIFFGIRKVFVDLGAERNLLAAENGIEKIAVEIKSFVGMYLLNISWYDSANKMLILRICESNL